MVSDKLVELRILLRRACMCEGKAAKKSTLSLKTKVLYLLKSRPLSPGEIISALSIAKPNVTALTNALEKEGLIEKKRGAHDRREISLSITPSGTAYLDERLEAIEKEFKNILTGEEDYESACKMLDEVISLLSFL